MDIHFIDNYKVSYLKAEKGQGLVFMLLLNRKQAPKGRDLLMVALLPCASVWILESVFHAPSLFSENEHVLIAF